MYYNSIKKLENLSETLFLPLYCRAIESNTKNPILIDEKSVQIVKNLDKYFSENKSNFNQMLLKRNLPKLYVIKISLLTKKIDEYANKFLTKNPNGLIVNLGCGLDLRYHRLADKKVDFYDIDFPEVINLKKQFIKEKSNYHLVGLSIFDFKWFDVLKQKKNKSILFIAQGVFEYLEENKVKSLILELQKNFPGSEIVFDVVNSYFVKKKHYINKKFQKRYNLSKEITFNFGIARSNELMSWNTGIMFLDEWSFYDAPHKKIRFHFLDRIYERFRKTFFIVHYKLD